MAAAPTRKRSKQQSDDFVIDLTLDDDDGNEAGPSRPSPPQRKKRASKKEPKPQPEKRVDAFGNTVRYSSAPSIKVLERIERAMPGSAHRMFLIDRKEMAGPESPGGRKVAFKVLGATGNCYDVAICRQPSCNCPDAAANGNWCKHLAFVFLRVLKLSRHNPIVWQKALLTAEVEEALRGTAATAAMAAAQQAGGADDVLASPAVRQRYQQLAGGSDAAAAVAAAESVRKPLEGDCPVCCDELRPEGEALVFCGTCGNNIHGACFDKWAAASKRSSGGAVTCVMCRAPWTGAGGGGGAAAAAAGGSSGYLNLAQFSEAHAAADTSLGALYGDRAVWLLANQGAIGRSQAARMWQAMGGR